MSNEEKYQAAFVESFSVEESPFDTSVEYNSIEAWDSIGHMELIANLEDAFDISMEIDDIVDFSSYEKGKEILKKYEVEI